ncbi:MAG: glycosyltransferase family 2 protein [Elusimicrobiota bacterium]|nr:MAG: glycosyltransferase family 2 protein [Elusimicrobiota bacterium]
MSAPRVSVVIPAYAAAAFIERTLDSVAAQTYRSFELIVVDDGSPDDTKSVVDRWLARTGTPGACVRRPNGRIAAARNTGLKEAKGELIATLDHDDLWTPDKLARCVAEFDAHPGTVLVGHHTDVVQDGVVRGIERKGPAVPGMYDRLLFEANAVAPSGAVFRRDKALEIGGFRERPEYNTVEDYDFWMRLAKTGPFRFIDAVLSSYTVIPGSASRRVEYHHSNLETLLRDHFAERLGPEPGPLARLRMRRRLSFVYRAAVAALLEPGSDAPLRRSYARRMLAAWPLSAKNLGRAAQALLAELSGR